ncbi:hypothetical protein, partial [Gordonia sp. (in: high G+C Gram-positive bacteria)]
LLSSQTPELPPLLADLGQFRQRFQQLREAVRDRVPLDWYSSDDPRYVDFKTLATRVERIILSETRLPENDDDTPARVLIEITSNRWERRN